MLIDGSVLANAPFRPAIAALQNRPARREVDRRFVYIDPKPGMTRGAARRRAARDEAPGFFATIFGALSDIPREQPIRDNLEAIEQRSATDPAPAGGSSRRCGPRSRRRSSARSARPSSCSSPTPKRLAAWRAARARRRRARGRLRLCRLRPSQARQRGRGGGRDGSSALGGGGDRGRHERVRQAIWREIREPRPRRRTTR